MGKSLIIELGWLLLLAAFAVGSVFPLHGTIGNEYLHVNILLAFLFSYYFRLALFFRQVAYLQYFPVQILFFLLSPVLFIKTIGKMQELFILFDTNDLLFFIAPDAQASTYAMNDAFQFFKKEFVLFSVGLLVVLVAVELRIALAFVERIRRMD